MAKKERPWTKIITFGLFIWLITVTIAHFLRPLQENNPLAFDAVVPMILIICVFFFLKIYLKKVEKNFLKESIALAIAWVIIGIGMDTITMIFGIIKTDLTSYLLGFGISYITIPFLVIRFGYITEKR